MSLRAGCFPHFKHCANFLLRNAHVASNMARMKLKIGNPATGSDFFPREGVRTRLLRALARDHVAFVGPRRTGKTSILKNITERPPTETTAVFLDLEKFSTVPEWLSALLAPTKELIQGEEKGDWLAKSGKSAKSLLAIIEKLEVLGNGITLTPNRSNPDAWRPLADQFHTLLRDANLPIYFLLDEFPWYLGHLARKHSAEEVEAVLNWFRSARQELAGGKTRFLVTGSIGLEGLLRRIGLSPTANDFDTIEIPPLTDEEALDFLMELSTGEEIPFNPTAGRRILKLMGANWPILLELFMSELQDKDLKKLPSMPELKELYESRMVRGSRNKYCHEMFTRLSKDELFSPTERRIAFECLKMLTVQPAIGGIDLEMIHSKIVPDEKVRSMTGDELGFVIDTLRHDGYLLRRDDGQYQFASNILRDYWIHRTA
jgi:hypothetical protein